MSAPVDLLLRALLPSAPPTTHRPAGPAPAAGTDPTSFATLLHRAQAGQIITGREVTVHPTAGVELTPEQLGRVGIAADRAEAAGASRALVLIDGRALVVDIGLRQVVRQASFDDQHVLTGIDAVVQAPHPASPDADAPVPLPLPGHGQSPPPALLHALQPTAGAHSPAPARRR